MRFLSNLNLNKNQLLNARIQNLDETSILAISNPVEGQIIFDTTNKELRIYTGTEWDIVGKEYTAGTGLDLANGVFSHSNTSDVVDLTAQARRYITGLTFDEFGHVTGFTTGTETVVDTNNYVNSIAFNPSTGFLSLERIGLTELTVNLDGRYLQEYIEVDTLDSVTDRGATTTNPITVGGLTVNGDTLITGNLTVNGTTTSVNTSSLEVADYIIEIAKNNTVALASYAGFVIPNYDGVNAGGLIIDANGEFRIGDVSYVDNTITDISSQAVMTRDELVNFADQDIVIWDDTNKRAVGKTALEAGIVKKYATFVGDGAQTQYTVTHNLGTNDITVAVREVSTNEIVYTDVIVTNNNQINVQFAVAPTLNSYRVIVTG